MDHLPRFPDSELLSWPLHASPMSRLQCGNQTGACCPSLHDQGLDLWTSASPPLCLWVLPCGDLCILNSSSLWGSQTWGHAFWFGWLTRALIAALPLRLTWTPLLTSPPGLLAPHALKTTHPKPSLPPRAKSPWSFVTHGSCDPAPSLQLSGGSGLHWSSCLGFRSREWLGMNKRKERNEYMKNGWTNKLHVEKADNKHTQNSLCFQT